MRITILGDVHGDIKWFEYACSQAEHRESNTIVQIGDFGWFPHTRWGSDFLYYADERLKQDDMWCYFIDGNHENFDDLLSHKELDDEGFVILPDLERIRYIPRGHTWTWDGVKFLGFGGAFSIDKEDRTEGVSWWPQEQPTFVEIYKAMDVGKVDAMFSHEAPGKSVV